MIYKYARLWLAFFKASFQADLEYRVNFVSRIVTDIVWYLAQIITFEALFRHTSLLGGWNLQQSRVFLGLLFVSDAIYMILLHENLEKMSDKVRKGDMDLLLVKPVNSQFMMSCQRVGTTMIANLLLASAWLVWAFLSLPEFSWPRLLWLLVLVPIGVVSLYGIRFMVSTTAVLFTRSENLQFLWYQVYRLGMRPDAIYAPWLRLLIWTVLPVGLIASVPTRFLLEPPDYRLLVLAIFVAGVFLYASHRWWNYALKHYTSASS